MFGRVELDWQEGLDQKQELVLLFLEILSRISHNLMAKRTLLAVLLELD